MGQKMRKKRIYAQFWAGRAMKMSIRSIIWKIKTLICKKLVHLRNFIGSGMKMRKKRIYAHFSVTRGIKMSICSSNWKIKLYRLNWHHASDKKEKATGTPDR